MGSTSSRDGAQSNHTVRGAGSSIALSSALAGLLGQPVGILQEDHLPPAAGRGQAALVTSSRVSATPNESPLGRTSSTSAWVPIRTVWHAGQVP